MNALTQLISYGTGPFLSFQAERGTLCEGYLGDQLWKLLCESNGAFFFGQSLRLFSTDDCSQSYGLSTWNSQQLWRFAYASLSHSVFFFAEDLFGYQFGILENKIVRLDPETAELSNVFSSFEEFAQAILDDTDYFTGMSIALDWQEALGAMPPRHRLIPKIPFVLGGEFDIENLLCVEGAKAMRIRGPLASQLSALPDGTVIEISIDDN